MAYTSDTQIKAVLRGIIDHTLPETDWTHGAYFAAAIALISDPKHDAVAEMPDIIRAYNVSRGNENTDTEGYHHTITLASLMAAKSVYESKPKDDPLHNTVADILASEYGKSSWLLTYWSKGLLFSVEARRHWVSPDIKDLPF